MSSRQRSEASRTCCRDAIRAATPSANVSSRAWNSSLMVNALGRARAFLLDRVVRRPMVFTDRRGLSYVLYPGENARVYFEHGGNYEVGETRLCEWILKDGDVVVDGGANIGLYSLLFGTLVGV